MNAADSVRRIRAPLLARILAEYRYTDREMGGVLGLRCGEIIGSWQDTDGAAAPDAYVPSPIPTANAIEYFHRQEGCDEICFIHAHPAGYRNLSYADRRFAREFLRLNPQYPWIGMMLAVDGELLLYMVHQLQEEEMPLPIEVI